MVMRTAFLFLIVVATVNAACDNGCSGHGTCGADDVCNCYDNWGVGLYDANPGDCSDRRCPFEIAWVDTPNQYGTFHEYAECAGRGLCDYSTGQCECFEGYTGKGCQRTTCPNDCSGHGTCEYIDDLAFAATWADYSDKGLKEHPKTFSYYDWDTRKSRACVCDATYGDIDCSKRLCGRGNDPLDRRDNTLDERVSQTQTITLTPESTSTDDFNGRTFALEFKSNINETFTTIPIVMKTASADMAELARDIQSALTHLPNNVIDGCTVWTESVATTYNANTYTSITIKVTFTGMNVQGNQNKLTVLWRECSDGCTPKINGLSIYTYVSSPDHIRYPNVTQVMDADYNAYECGRRGKCDYGTGECECFSGYTGKTCNTQTALV
jgi:hypothetical protein